MKLSDQVVSLELSKKLKDLGVKQESLFYWVDEGRYTPSRRINFKKKARVHWNSRVEERFISAFTVAELGQLLRLNRAEWLSCSIDPVNKIFVTNY